MIRCDSGITLYLAMFVTENSLEVYKEKLVSDFESVTSICQAIFNLATLKLAGPFFNWFPFSIFKKSRYFRL